MDYSCCYVLSDNDDLKYYNEMMISLSSLRYVGFTGRVHVIVDNQTAVLLDPKHKELEELSAEIIIVNTDDNYSQIEKSRYIKTSVRKFITGNVLYIDTDTIFVTNLPETISDDEFAMVPDTNGLDNQFAFVWHNERLRQYGSQFQNGSQFFNSGVIWIRDTGSVHDAFERWHSLWLEMLTCGIVNDQVSLNDLYNKKEIMINELDDRLNVQITQDYFSPSLLNKAIILHILKGENTSIIYPLFDPKVQQIDYHHEYIQAIIHDPIAAFPACRWLERGRCMDSYINTETFSTGFSIYMNHKRIFHALECFLRERRKVKQTISKLGKRMIKSK